MATFDAILHRINITLERTEKRVEELKQQREEVLRLIAATTPPPAKK